MKLFNILLYLSNQNIILISILASLLLIGLVILIVFLVLKNKKNKRICVSNEKIIKLASSLGNNNLIDYKINNNKLILEVKDIKLVNTELLKELKLGVMASQNKLTVFLKDVDQKELKRYLDIKK